MTSRNDPLLVGNNLAVLVAAAELARRERPFTLLTDGKAPGGHFGGMNIDGHDFDIGMVMFEKCSPARPDQDLRRYDPAVRNDWTRYGHLAGAWLESQIELRRTPTPQCLVDGRVWPDPLIANRLDVFAHARPPAPPLLPRSDARHAMHKLQGEVYESLSYADAAHLNHGAALHAHYIEPFVQKLLGVSSHDFLARYHRAGWVPLYHPETLAGAIADLPVSLGEYPFWTSSSGFVGELVQRLRSQLEASPVAQVIAGPLQQLQAVPGRLSARADTGPGWSSGRAALGLAADRCQTLLGGLPGQSLGQSAPVALPAASVSLLFARVRADAIGRATGCLMVVDDELASYRLTDQDALAGRDAAWHRVTIEASPDRLARQHPGVTPEAALTSELSHLMQLRGKEALQASKCITARNALVLPTTQAVQTAEAAHAALQAALPGVALSGSLLGYGVASLNDQLVQGLKMAEELS